MCCFWPFSFSFFLLFLAGGNDDALRLVGWLRPKERVAVWEQWWRWRRCAEDMMIAVGSGVERKAGDSRYFVLALSLCVRVERDRKREIVNDDNQETQNFIITCEVRVWSEFPEGLTRQLSN
jgi:hypothetical protein